MGGAIRAVPALYGIERRYGSADAALVTLYLHQLLSGRERTTFSYLFLAVKFSFGLAD